MGTTAAPQWARKSRVLSRVRIHPHTPTHTHRHRAEQSCLTRSVITMQACTVLSCLFHFYSILSGAEALSVCIEYASGLGKQMFLNKASCLPVSLFFCFFFFFNCFSLQFAGIICVGVLTSVPTIVEGSTLFSMWVWMWECASVSAYEGVFVCVCVWECVLF